LRADAQTSLLRVAGVHFEAHATLEDLEHNDPTGLQELIGLTDGQDGPIGDGLEEGRGIGARTGEERKAPRKAVASSDDADGRTETPR
jgi:hypothetical protein